MLCSSHRVSTWTECQGSDIFATPHPLQGTPVNAGEADLTPGLGTFPREGNGSTFQYSCLGNPMDRGDWWAIVYVVAKSQTQLSD